jgi:hypothetical protein
MVDERRRPLLHVTTRVENLGAKKEKKAELRIPSAPAMLAGFLVES